MDAYTCDQCDWKYVWAMGDRVKAVKMHELAHLLGKTSESRSFKIKVPGYLIDKGAESPRGVQWR